MIRPLRMIHRQVFVIIGIALPIAFAISIAARKPPAITDNLPAQLSAAPNLFNNVIWERADLFSKAGIGVQLRRENVDSGSFAVSFRAPEDFAKPDVLVYWVTGETTTGDALPDNARLLGTFSTAELKLPADLAGGDGRLILYSLADQEIVDISKPFGTAAVK